VLTSRGAEDWVAPATHGTASWCGLYQQDIVPAASTGAGQAILLTPLTPLQLCAEVQECLAHLLQLLSTGGTAALHEALQLLLQQHQLLLPIINLLQSCTCADRPIVIPHSSR
jgi:hypothetical protein